MTGHHIATDSKGKYLSRANHRRNAEAGIQRDAADPIAGCPLDLAAEQGMATPVVPNQFAVGKNQIIHKDAGDVS